MRMYRMFMTALACAVLLPAVAEAQVTYRIAHRGVLGIMTESTVQPGAPPSTERVIIDVLPNSPAAQAGLARGDTVVSINRRAATEEVMAAPFEPGDTVVVRIRRQGQERDVTVIAAERTPLMQTFTVNALPDTVRRQIEVIMEAVRGQADTLNLRNLTIERLRGDSSIVFRFGDDSTRTMRVVPLREGLINLDSLRQTIEGARMFRFDATGRPIPIDSLSGFGNARLRAVEVERALPGEIFARGFGIGMRAVAGAELSDLNPGLAEYFGVTDGVLVLNAHEGTPAARAGVRAGDVIVQVDGAAIASIAELRSAFDTAGGPGTTVRLRVLRHGREVDLALTR